MTQEMPRTVETRRDVVAAFCCETCACGARKPRFMAFCIACYRSLPQPEKKALYKAFGKGFEGAYVKALGWLAGHEPRMKQGSLLDEASGVEV